MLTLFKAGQSRLGVRVMGPVQRLSWVYVDDLVVAIVAMVLDERHGDYTYFASSDQVIDTTQLWQALRVALNRRIAVIPIPGPVLSLVASVAVRVSSWFGLHNQLDHKQVAQMRAKAFVCSSAALQQDLGWRAEVELEDAFCRTAEGYRALGWL